MEETNKLIDAAAEQVRALNPDSPYRGCALSSLSSARDNLKWHGEWQARKDEAKAKAEAEALKAAQELVAQAAAKAEAENATATTATPTEDGTLPGDASQAEPLKP